MGAGENKALELHQNFEEKKNYNRKNSHVFLLERRLQKLHLTTIEQKEAFHWKQAFHYKEVFGGFHRIKIKPCHFSEFCLTNKMGITFWNC